MKVGILTHYYKNLNYGGVLQAYALAEAINDMGICAEQICYEMDIKNLESGNNGKNLKREICRTAKKLIKKLVDSDKWKDNTRRQLLSCFSDWCLKNVPQSKKVYDCFNIKKCLKLYDCFITGSDQVWNYEWYDKNFFLGFVPKGKMKISYAASVGHTKIKERSQEVFRKHLKDFSAISVREKASVDMLKNIIDTKVEFVADPVFLLDRCKWESLANKRIVEENYVFCYFLGKSKDVAEIAIKYAKQNNLKIVTLKQLDIFAETDDVDIIKLENIGPGGFLSLIKNAENIITDSFHAFAFSIIFERQVFVFRKMPEKGMGVRIESLAKLAGCEEHFCDTDEKRSVDYLNKLEPIDYTVGTEGLKTLINSSKKYLGKALGKE